MANPTQISQNGDTGLTSLVLILRFYGFPVEPEQIEHEFGSPITELDILRCAKRFKLKARSIESSWEKLQRTQLPTIARTSDDRFLLLTRIGKDAVLIRNLTTGRPQRIAREEFETQWSRRLILMTRRASLGDMITRFDINWFFQAMHTYRGLLGEVLVASFFLQLFGLVSPLFFQVVIDKVLVHRSLTTLNVLVFGLVGVSIFESLLTALRTYVSSHTTSRIDVELGRRLFRHLVALPISYFQARRVGDSVARVREVENIRNFLTSSALTLVIDLLFTIVFLAVMACYSMFLTLIVLISFPFYITISHVATPIFRAKLNEKFNRGAENQSFLVESVTGIETLKAMAVEPQMQRRWEEQLAGYVRSSFSVLNLGNWASQLVQLTSKLTTAAILFFGAKSVINGDLTVGELVAFNMLSGRVAQPVLRLTQMWQDFRQARVSIERLGDILNTMPEPMFTPGRTGLPKIKGDVTFEHVTFRYKVDGPEILHDIDLSISAGDVIGIVGSSGSGKSTLTKLVQRLYVPESGRVLIDGNDLTMVDISSLRRQIGVVLQENILFNRSIRENIALSDLGMPLDRVKAAAELAGAHDFILELPDGYDSSIGERGAGLSGGQRQRIAIARALITNPRILIFDEATSALDYESESLIQKNMQRIVQGRTVIIIAHRLSAVRDAKKIVVIEKGRIVESDTHEELLKKERGRYAALWRMQGGHKVG